MRTCTVCVCTCVYVNMLCFTLLSVFWEPIPVGHSLCLLLCTVDTTKHTGRVGGLVPVCESTKQSCFKINELYTTIVI